MSTSGMLPLLAAAGLLVVVWAGQRRLIYLPSGNLRTPAQTGLTDARTVSIPTADGLTLGAWWVPARPPARHVTVIVFNGNAGNRSDRAPIARALSDAGFSVLLSDYRGYGGNPGSPSETALVADAVAVHDYVRSRPEGDAGRLIYLGESLGTGVAVALAEQRAPAALILRSPFTSLVDIAAHHYWFLPVRWLVWDRFDSFSRRGRIGCPTTFIAGDRDSVVPFLLTRRLFNTWPGPKRLIVVAGADHNDAVLVAGKAVIEAVRDAADAFDGGRGGT
jgi:fermentation-respiration switch protein FrsA (DUF1100 family)